MSRRKKTHRREPVPPVRTITLKSSKYQPSKAELEEEVRIDTTPEKLSKAVLRQVKIERED